MYLLNAEGGVEFTSRHKEDVLRWHYCDDAMIPLAMTIINYQLSKCDDAMIIMK